MMIGQCLHQLNPSHIRGFLLAELSFEAEVKRRAMAID